MNDGTGNCFPTAAKAVLAFCSDRLGASCWDGDSQRALAQLERLKEEHEAGPEDLRVVHGWVTRPSDGRRHVHAWIEQVLPFDPCKLVVVIDCANGNDGCMPRSLYYKAGKIDTVVAHTYEEVLRHTCSTGHWGPWDARMEEAA